MMINDRCIYSSMVTRARIDAIVCTIDLVKRDSEIKVLIGCTEEEKLAIESLYEAFPPMCGLFLRR